MAKRQHAVKSRSAAGDAFSGVAFRVLRLAGLLTAAGDTLSAPAGQSSARWQVLAGAEDAPASVADVARRLGLARQSVQRVADVLVEEGLGVYEENPAHKRAQLLRLTARGRAALAAIQDAQRVWADELGGKIGARDLRAAAKVLDAVAEAIAERA